MLSWFNQIKQTFIFNFIEGNRWKYITNGLLVTLEVTLFALLIGMCIGVVVAMIRSSYDKNRDEMRPGLGKAVMTALNAVAKVYLTVIRGTPVVVQLLIGYFVIFVSSTNTVMVASLVFGINSGAYITEIIRGGIMSIDAGQFEAGRSDVGKRGVVRDAAVHRRVLTELLNFFGALGLTAEQLTYSPITGGEGNIEYLVRLRRTDGASAAAWDVSRLVAQTFVALGR